jgi:tetraacyldisaccharide 4'-kinase
LLDMSERAAVRREAARLAPDAAWAEVTHEPESLLQILYDRTVRRKSIETLFGVPVGAFCGLGNPAGFRHTLDICGFKVEQFREFPDHHHYNRADVRSLAEWAETLGVEALVCTHKDLVKLGVDRLGSVELFALGIGIKFLAGQAELEEKLCRLLEDRPASDDDSY